VVTIDDVRALAGQFPRAYETLVRDRVKFRVGKIVFVAFSADETLMGFGFPKEERAALVAAEPAKFLLPGTGDMRWNWVVTRLSALDHEEMRQLVTDAWRMVVPKSVARAWDECLADPAAPADRPGRHPAGP
jgi:hypothetical protein